MWKCPSDLSVSKNCIDGNLEMVERRDPDNLPHFLLQAWCMWTIPKFALKGTICTEKRINISQKDLSIALNNHGRHGLLSFLSSLPISILRN